MHPASHGTDRPSEELLWTSIGGLLLFKVPSTSPPPPLMPHDPRAVPSSVYFKPPPRNAHLGRCTGTFGAGDLEKGNEFSFNSTDDYDDDLEGRGCPRKASNRGGGGG